MSQSLRTMFYSLFEQKHLMVASTSHPGLSEGRVVIWGGGVRGGVGSRLGPSAFSLTIVFHRMFSRGSQAPSIWFSLNSHAREYSTA